MAANQGPFAVLLVRFLRLHLVANCLLLQGFSLDIDNSYCKCENFPIEDRPFVAIWNAPTGGCNVNYSININLKNFDILENPEQTWNGKYVTVFYNAQLGLYPYFTNEEGTNSYNGGMPQLVNLASHLKKAKEDITKKIPDPNFDGVAVIDWEGWRPIWERNFDSKRIYQSKSVDLVQEKHPDWSMTQLIEEAKEKFEESARTLMESSIKLAQRLRPKGQWGFYGFPNCFGTDDSNYHCSHEHKEMNNKLKWLFSSSSALYPSVYIYDKQPWNKAFVHGRLEEAFRVATMASIEIKRRLPVFPYFRHLYEGKPTEFDFLSDIDLRNTIGQAADMGAAGVIMWGNRRDENTSPQVCRELNHYIETTLGPYFESVRHQIESCSELKCNGRGRCISSRLIDSSWVVKEPHIYRQTCMGSPRKFSPYIRQHSAQHHQPLQHVHRTKNHNKPAKSNKVENKERLKNALNTKDKELLTKELAFLNSSAHDKKSSLSRHHNSSDGFVVFMSSQGSAVEVNKAPQEHSGLTVSGGLHYHDSQSFPQTAVKEAMVPSKLMLCNNSSPGSSDCEIIKESPSTFARGYHFPHLYVMFICVSLGSALLISSAFIVSYYYCHIHKRISESKVECGEQRDNQQVRNDEKLSLGQR